MVEELQLSQEEKWVLYNVVNGIRRERALNEPIMLTITLDHESIEASLFADHDEHLEPEANMSRSIKEMLHEIVRLQIQTQKDLERAAHFRDENDKLTNGIINKIIDDHPRKDFFKQKLGL